MRLLLTICNYLVNILGHRILRVIQNKEITRKIREKKIEILTFCICFSHNIITSSICSTISLFFNNISSVIAGSLSSGIFGIVSKISPSTCSNVLHNQNKKHKAISKKGGNSDLKIGNKGNIYQFFN